VAVAPTQPSSSFLQPAGWEDGRQTARIKIKVNFQFKGYFQPGKQVKVHNYTVESNSFYNASG
jgi:hypothetical protein